MPVGCATVLGMLPLTGRCCPSPSPSPRKDGERGSAGDAASHRSGLHPTPFHPTPYTSPSRGGGIHLMFAVGAVDVMVVGEIVRMIVAVVFATAAVAVVGVIVRMRIGIDEGGGQAALDGH